MQKIQQMNKKVRARLHYANISIPPFVHCLLCILLFAAKGFHEVLRGKVVYELQDEQVFLSLSAKFAQFFLQT